MNLPVPEDETSSISLTTVEPAPAPQLALLSSLGALSLNTHHDPPTEVPTVSSNGAPVSTSDRIISDALAYSQSLLTDTNANEPPSPATSSTRTTVIFQPACALHRYIRDEDIGTIVERPERLRAVKTGVAAAWARLEERQIAQGGTRWTAPIDTSQGGSDELDDLLKGLSLSSEPAKTDVKGKGKAREVIGGPFDIRDSSAMMRLDEDALRLVHPSPNRAPQDDDDDDGEGWSTVPSTSATQPGPLPSSSPSRQSRRTSGSASPTKRAVSSAPQPWPHQLQTLCRRSSSAILVEPFSEIPAHLPQGDLYLCEGSEQAIFGALGAVCEGVDRIAARAGNCSRAFIAIRPPGHHCGEANPQGFCFVNNVAVAAAHAFIKHGIHRVIILDIDLHHGNGTQEIVYRINTEAQRILAERMRSTTAASPRKSNSPRKVASAPPPPALPKPPQPLQIMYGSLHDIWSYPCEDGDPSLVAAASLSLAGPHGQWLSNVHLEQFRSEDQFHEELYPRYRNGLIGKAEQFCRENGAEGDETLVIISAGFDASEHESPGMSRHNRNVPTSFYRRFARDAVSLATDFAGGKIMGVLEGGYSDRALASGTAAFLTGLVEEQKGVHEAWRQDQQDSWWAERHLKDLEKACSMAKTRRGVPSTLVGVEANASASRSWLARSVEIFARIEDGAGPPSPAAGSSRTKSESALPTPEASGTRQLRERKIRHNYAGMDDGSSPGSSPGQTKRGGSTASAVTAAAGPSRVKQVTQEEAGALPMPVPFVSVLPGLALGKEEAEVVPSPAKQAVRFTWKQGGFGGEPRA